MTFTLYLGYNGHVTVSNVKPISYGRKWGLKGEKDTQPYAWPFVCFHIAARQSFNSISSKISFGVLVKKLFWSSSKKIILEF